MKVSRGLPLAGHCTALQAHAAEGDFRQCNSLLWKNAGSPLPCIAVLQEMENSKGSHPTWELALMQEEANCISTNLTILFPFQESEQESCVSHRTFPTFSDLL